MAGSRGKQTVRNMLQSMAVITLVAGVIYIFVPHNEDHDPIRTVDYSVELNTARRAAPYPVAAPVAAELPKGWRATSVSYEPMGKDGAAWHLGFHDDDREYVAVEQSDARPVPYIERVTQRARETKRTQEIAGRTWTRYTGRQYDALVLKEDGVTTVVTGTASFDHLTKMAAALQTRKG